MYSEYFVIAIAYQMDHWMDEYDTMITETLCKLCFCPSLSLVTAQSHMLCLFIVTNVDITLVVPVMVLGSLPSNCNSNHVRSHFLMIDNWNQLIY